MLEETHRRLAKELGKALCLSRSHQEMLEEGSVLPDYQEDFPHHIKKEKEIRNLLHRSRVTFLNGDDECYSLLGMAFHYIQDKWTFKARTRDKHTKWEQLINKSVLLDEETLTENIQTATIPLKFKEAYLGFLKTVNLDIESPMFWGHLVEEDGRFDPDRSIDRSRDSVLGDMILGMLRRSANYRSGVRAQERLLSIEEIEKHYGFGIRIYALAARAWVCFDSNGTTVLPSFRLFRGLIDQSVEKVSQTREMVRYTTPTIDLNVAFVLCREVGKRVLSHEFRWTADALDYEGLERKGFVIG